MIPLGTVDRGFLLYTNVRSGVFKAVTVI